MFYKSTKLILQEWKMKKQPHLLILIINNQECNFLNVFFGNSCAVGVLALEFGLNAF